MEKATLNTCGIWIRLLFWEEVREEGQRRGRKGVVDKFGQVGVCSLWRSLLQISFMVLFHGICEFLSFSFMRS